MPGPTKGTELAKHRPCPQGAYNQLDSISGTLGGECVNSRAGVSQVLTALRVGEAGFSSAVGPRCGSRGVK